MSEPTGAIHDIGYRHYDGPRLGASYIRRSLYVDTLRGAFGLGRSARSKVMPFLLLAVMVLPAIAMGIVTGYFGLEQLPLGYTSYYFAFQLVPAAFSPLAMMKSMWCSLRSWGASMRTARRPGFPTTSPMTRMRNAGSPA